MNILIIEDDIFLAKHIARVFEKKDATQKVTLLDRPENFLREFAKIRTYDIVVTDLCFPELSRFSGFDVIEMIRSEKYDIPIIVISGLSDISDLERAFLLGANDYIIKPFRLLELDVRATNWYKQYYLKHCETLGDISIYHSLEYHIKIHEFYYNSLHIPLPKKWKHLLLLFFTQSETLLCESTLEEKLYGDHERIETRNIRVNIARLRKILSRYGIDHWIRNVAGEGYIFSAK